MFNYIELVLICDNPYLKLNNLTADTVATSWLNNTLVTFLSSQAHDVQLGWVFRKGKRPDGSFYKLRVSQPAVASDYTKYMAGVDLQ